MTRLTTNIINNGDDLHLIVIPDKSQYNAKSIHKRKARCLGEAQLSNGMNKYWVAIAITLSLIYLNNSNNLRVNCQDNSTSPEYNQTVELRTVNTTGVSGIPTASISSENLQIETETLDASESSNVSQQQNDSSKVMVKIPSATVLRPSIEEVASELSRKYLNLEHENWRFKHSTQPPLANSRPSTNSGSLQLETNPIAAVNNSNANNQSQESRQNENLFQALRVNEAEKDIQRSVDSLEARVKNKTVDVLTSSHFSSINPGYVVNLQAQKNRSSEGENFLKKAEEHYKEQYLNIDTSPINVGDIRSRQTSGLAKGRGLSEDNELYQCHQYLQRHSSSPHVGSSIFPNSDVVSSSQIVADQQLPCSCDLRRHLDVNSPNQSSYFLATWLSCDNVQLIGSRLFNPNPSKYNDKDDASKVDESSSGAPIYDDLESEPVLSRFSQRDAGLQILHSQMFDYLQLRHLKSIDLSNNRIRQIKVDAFHGIETKLEYLNLADNLLGDSRVVFTDSAQHSTHRRSNIVDDSNNFNNGKLLFNSDDLNRLRNLKWLSLHNNLIIELSPNLFAKSSHQSTVNSGIKPTQECNELIYLDLSENLLRQVPSESIKSLAKLETLNLSGNRIATLNQLSKFPKSIKYLDLSKNSITSIKQCDLIDIPNLVDLNLSNNQLSHLDHNAFVSSLVGINLAHQQQISQRDPQVGLILSHEYRHSNRRKRNVDEMAMGESEPMSNFSDSDDLEASESILASVSRHVTSVRQTIREDSASSTSQSQFNSILKLNLSYNFLEKVPGDSLLKFPNLRHLDLSYNRIRRLDSNYLCSIYNLVENVRFLDLSGNLLSLPGNGISRTEEQKNSTYLGGAKSTLHYGYNTGANVYQLNKLFGCLQKIEKLLLSTNRLGTTERNNEQTIGNREDLSIDLVEASVLSSPIEEQPIEDYNGNTYDKEYKDQDQRLEIKVGEGLGTRQLKSLDLSDNQLSSMPNFKQVLNQQSTATINGSNSNNPNAVNITDQLNNWLASRIQLEELNLNFNHIDRLDQSDFELIFHLRKLSLDYNRLSVLPAKLMRKFTNLDELSLSGNRLTNLEPINELLERSAKSLRILNLSNNRLADWPAISRPIVSSPIDVPASASTSHNREFKQNTQLAYEDQASISFALEELNLDGNLMTSANISSLFDQIIYMKSLKFLYLRHNLLTKVKSEWFKFSNANLQRLSFTGNKINNIDLGSFTSNQVNELLVLELDYNLLKELKRKSFDSLPKLRELNLANNLIHTINSETFHQINSLQILKLNNNKLTSWKCEYFSNLCNSITGDINADISSILSSTLNNSNSNASQPMRLLPAPKNYMSSLIELDLGHNSLSQLRVNSISVHTKLVKLNLEHNKLSFIPHDLFKATISGSSLGRQIQLVSSLKYINLANNRIQTIDNINFRPLKNLVSIDMSFNELQTLGRDVVLMDPKSLQKEQNNRRVVVSNNLTNILMEDDEIFLNRNNSHTRHSRSAGSPIQSTSNWPALSKLRNLNVAFNQITMLNQSLLSELSPFALLNLNLSSNYLDSESLPVGFFTKIAANPTRSSAIGGQDLTHVNYDLIFTLKLESLDLSHNRLHEFPSNLLENHFSSMESCSLSHNRIQNLIPNLNIMIQIKSLNLEFNPLNRESNDLILFEQRNVRNLNLAATRLYAIQQATAAADHLIHGASPVQIKHRLANQTSQLDLIRSISRQIDAPYVRNLNLSSNQLVWLASNVFDRMHSLQTLDISNNQLTRLHLLNNQLSVVAQSLEYLNIANNLFTNIDSNDFSQLSKLRHLDLSNLLSLQKMNCKFLSKLGSLNKLKMFNYPQLKLNLNNQLNMLIPAGQYPERIHKKIAQELVMSTVGQHCFRDNIIVRQEIPLGDAFTEIDEHHYEDVDTLKWYNIEELELELFSNFEGIDQNSLSRSFSLRNELSQLLGHQTKKLTLIGLNLTSVSDDSFLGVTSDELKLKISYTSISHLPLRQILSSVAKRTKLYLDFRNNNIQTIDTTNLQLLDELQQNNQAFHHGDRSALRLANNPFKCDCQTRPLWLWLNQKWDLIEQSQSNEEPAVDNTAPGITNHLLKFNALTQTSDVKCHYPQKLRGKLAQHVYYNDLVCKGSSETSTGHRQAKRRNETLKSSESHYLTSKSYSDSIEVDDLDDDDYLDLETRSDIVKLTKFNKYQPTIANYSTYFTNDLQVPMISDNIETMFNENNPSTESNMTNKMAKRDQNSNSQIDPWGSSESQGEPSPMNTKYSRHRPNTQQKHTHFGTLTNLNQLHFAKTLGSRAQVAKSSFLTESDVTILTSISVAMTLMSFIIITICLFKYKMDKNDNERILKVPKSQLPAVKSFYIDNQTHSASVSTKGDRKADTRSSSSSKSSSNSSKQLRKSNSLSINKFSTSHQSSRSARIIKKPQHYTSQQVLVPIPQAQRGSPGSLAPQNFLMRSPTIRRMQGLATNASDWFKFTLKAYPSNAASRRRRIFVGEKLVGGSQLTTAQMDGKYVAAPKLISSNNPLSVAGCPLHAFKAVKRFQDQARQGIKNVIVDETCVYCSRLLTSIQQTKVQYIIPPSDNNSPAPLNNSQERDSIDIIVESQNISSESREANNTRDSEETHTDPNDYFSPKFMKALARHLDREDQSATVAQWNQQSQKFRKPGVYHSRNQQFKQMRTFGLAQCSNSDTLNSGKTQHSESDLGFSQIPTVDVDGRFTYQSGSQIDSPTVDMNTFVTRQSIISGSSQGPNDMLYIIQGEISDSNQTDTRDTSRLSNYNVSHARDVYALNVQSPMSRLDSVMNDECSHSSSPVTYKFMRSSPSATTMSSHQAEHLVTHPDHKLESYQTFQGSAHSDDSHCVDQVPIQSQLDRTSVIEHSSDIREAEPGTSGAERRDCISLDIENLKTGQASPRDEHIIISRL